MEQSVVKKTNINTPRLDNLFAIIFGLAFFGLSWFAFSIPSIGNEWVHVIRIPMLLLGIHLIIHPIRDLLKKFFLTRIIYRTLQVISALTFILIYAFSLFGRVMIAMIMVFMFLLIFISKVLEYFNINNPLEVGLFLTFTILAIVFSFKGNKIVNWLAIKMEGGDSKKINGDLIIINKYLGQSQIRYLVYCIYFILIVISTIFHLIGQNSYEPDQNFMFLSLQSFAAFLAFETIIEKSQLMSPWVNLSKSLDGGFRSLKKKRLQDIFNDEGKL